ncbi:D-aminopeptidase [compost metagenome]
MFLINAYAAALHNVPVVFVSGDKGLIDEVKQTNGSIKTLSVKEGVGQCTINIHPNKAIKDIKALVKEALVTDYSLCKITLPKTFNIDLAYERHEKAYRNSFYPGAKLIEPRVISYTTDNYYEVLRLFHFLT